MAFEKTKAKVEKAKATVKETVSKIKEESKKPSSQKAESDKAAAATKAYSAANSSKGGVGSSAGKTAEKAELQKAKQTTNIGPMDYGKYNTVAEYEQAKKNAAKKDAQVNWQSEQAAEKAYTEKHNQGGTSKPAAKAAPVAPVPPPPPPVDPSIGSSYEGASDQMKAYDQYAQQALGKSPAEAMQMAKAASAKEQADLASADAYNTASMGGNAADMMRIAQAASAQTAQSQSDQAVQQAAKAARTSGAMGGAAALAATGQAANAYGQAQAQGQQAYYQGAQMGQGRAADMSQRAQAAQKQYFDTTQLGAQLGSEMSGRLQNKEADATQRYGIEKGVQTAAAANKTAQRGQNINLAGGIIGAVGGLAGLFSDRNLKTDIQPDKLTDGLSKIKAYSYKYKGGMKPEAGVMAQDLEKTAMAPAVKETPMGKMVDTNRLTTMNTGALSEHEKRLRDVEKLISNMKSVKKPEAK